MCSIWAYVLTATWNLRRRPFRTKINHRNQPNVAIKRRSPRQIVKRCFFGWWMLVPTCCRGSQSTEGSKKNFPPGNFYMAAKLGGREKIARRCKRNGRRNFLIRDQSILQNCSLRNNLHFVARRPDLPRVSRNTSTRSIDWLENR